MNFMKYYGCSLSLYDYRNISNIETFFKRSDWSFTKFWFIFWSVIHIQEIITLIPASTTSLRDVRTYFRTSMATFVRFWLKKTNAFLPTGRLLVIYWTGVDNWDIIITNAQKHNMRITTAFSDFMGIYQLSVENK